MRSFIFLIILLYTTSNTCCQNIITATYTSGDIPTSYQGYNENCNSSYTIIPIALPVGDNYIVDSVIVMYNMTTSGSTAAMSHQRSKIKFENNNMEETNDAAGIGGAGTMIYQRKLTIANGSYPGGTILKFQMKAYRTFFTPLGCNTVTNKVDNNTWKITVHYSDEIKNSKNGVNIADPTQTLQINGKIKISNDTLAPQSGTIRYNATIKDFEGYDGSEWKSLTSTVCDAKGGGWGPNAVSENQIGSTQGSYAMSVAMEENFAVVGLPFVTVSGKLFAGRVDIYKKVNNFWEYSASIVSPEVDDYDHFGLSVDMKGDFIIIGAPLKNQAQGKAYIYKRDGNNWSHQATLESSSPIANDRFGKAVSITYGYAIIGAEGNNGSVYIYKNTNTNWDFQDQIQGSPNSYFGSDVSIDFDYFAVSNQSLSPFLGSVLIYKRMGNLWQYNTTLNLSNGASGDRFGYSLSLKGKTLAVGVPGRTVNGNLSQGIVCVYKRFEQAWSLSDTIKSMDGAPGDKFGEEVKVDDDNLVIGAPEKEIGGKIKVGKSYVYNLFNNKYNLDNELTVSDPEQGDYFGGGIDIFQNHIITTASGKYVGGGGRVYFFHK